MCHKKIIQRHKKNYGNKKKVNSNPLQTRKRGETKIYDCKKKGCVFNKQTFFSNDDDNMNLQIMGGVLVRSHPLLFSFSFSLLLLCNLPKLVTNPRHLLQLP